MSDLISRADAVKAIRKCKFDSDMPSDWYIGMECAQDIVEQLPSAEATKKKAELKENGDWDCPDVDCYECDHHRGVEWCSLAIPKHEEIDETYKMANEAFFEGFEFAEKRYRLLIETIEELDEKLAEAEWIPCGERLPSKDGRYLVTYPLFLLKGERVDVLWYGKPLMPNIKVKGKCWYRSDCEYGDVVYDEVIAWMPLPKPYREDGEE